ncbi:hypothetical protein [Bailinhaonella thermotolerans]|uniref:hypothetical protein n=1 Tax=Bailinhaonella thermotolerans TaxID=1070861 RepID=UPI001A8F13C7|nr:hypothetical protein [Bailinhaonella thermotolerans]
MACPLCPGDTRSGGPCEDHAPLLGAALRAIVATLPPAPDETPHVQVRVPGSGFTVCGFEEDPALRRQLAAAVQAPSGSQERRWDARELLLVADSLVDDVSLTATAEAAGTSTETVKDMICELGTLAVHHFGAVTDRSALPAGFSRGRADTRDISRSLRGLREHRRTRRVDEAFVERFLERKYHKTDLRLSSEHLGVVWVFARTGNLAGLPRVAPRQPELMAMLLAAWDVFQHAIDDAAHAASRLAGWSLADEPPPAQEFEEQLAKMTWAQPALCAELTRRHRALSPTGGGWSRLARVLADFAAALDKDSHAWIPTRIGDITTAQLEMLSGPKRAPDGDDAGP